MECVFAYIRVATGAAKRGVLRVDCDGVRFSGQTKKDDSNKPNGPAISFYLHTLPSPALRKALTSAMKTFHPLHIPSHVYFLLKFCKSLQLFQVRITCRRNILSIILVTFGAKRVSQFFCKKNKSKLVLPFYTKKRA